MPRRPPDFKYLYVAAPNPYYKVGTMLEYWESENTVQEVKMVDGRPSGYVGICIVMNEELRKYTIALQRRGLDKYKGGFLQ